MREGKIGTVVHKNPITTEQMQELFASGQLGDADTNDLWQLLRRAWFYLTSTLEKEEEKIKESSPKRC